jgi:hypothetical protein
MDSIEKQVVKQFMDACTGSKLRPGDQRLIYFAELLCDTDLDLDKLNSILQYAVQCRQVEIARIFIRDGRADPGLMNGWLLHWAAEHGDVKMVRFLLETGKVDPLSDEKYALKMALELGHTKIVELLRSDPRIRYARMEISSPEF